ncbi:MAG: hypothetical protein P4M11_14870 [Candidatus Pacebacteria bacterium]|nr:hypothetical protein [Candidatus Paceibacterota bacterium]
MLLSLTMEPPSQPPSHRDSYSPRVKIMKQQIQDSAQSRIQHLASQQIQFKARDSNRYKRSLDRAANEGAELLRAVEQVADGTRAPAAETILNIRRSLGWVKPGVGKVAKPNARTHSEAEIREAGPAVKVAVDDTLSQGKSSPSKEIEDYVLSCKAENVERLLSTMLPQLSVPRSVRNVARVLPQETFRNPRLQKYLQKFVAKQIAVRSLANALPVDPAAVDAVIESVEKSIIPRRSAEASRDSPSKQYAGKYSGRSRANAEKALSLPRLTRIEEVPVLEEGKKRRKKRGLPQLVVAKSVLNARKKNRRALF